MPFLILIALLMFGFIAQATINRQILSMKSWPKALRLSLATVTFVLLVSPVELVDSLSSTLYLTLLLGFFYQIFHPHLDFFQIENGYLTVASSCFSYVYFRKAIT